MGTGGNICAKIVFFLLLGALAVMVGLIVTEYRGSSDGKYPFSMSNFSIFSYLRANCEQLLLNTVNLAIYYFKVMNLWIVMLCVLVDRRTCHHLASLTCLYKGT
jgi:hypothetical protein